VVTSGKQFETIVRLARAKLRVAELEDDGPRRRELAEDAVELLEPLEAQGKLHSMDDEALLVRAREMGVAPR
jgi:hypothetical protein